MANSLSAATARDVQDFEVTTGMLPSTFAELCARARVNDPFATPESSFSPNVLDAVSRVVGPPPASNRSKRNLRSCIHQLETGDWKLKPSSILFYFGHATLTNERFLRALKDSSKTGVDFATFHREVQRCRDARRAGNDQTAKTRQQWHPQDCLDAIEAVRPQTPAATGASGGDSTAADRPNSRNNDELGISDHDDQTDTGMDGDGFRVADIGDAHDVGDFDADEDMGSDSESQVRRAEDITPKGSRSASGKTTELNRPATSASPVDTEQTGPERGGSGYPDTYDSDGESEDDFPPPSLSPTKVSTGGDGITSHAESKANPATGAEIAQGAPPHSTASRASSSFEVGGQEHPESPTTLWRTEKKRSQSDMVDASVTKKRRTETGTPLDPKLVLISSPSGPGSSEDDTDQPKVNEVVELDPIELSAAATVPQAEPVLPDANNVVQHTAVADSAAGTMVDRLGPGQWLSGEDIATALDLLMPPSVLVVDCANTARKPDSIFRPVINHTIESLPALVLPMNAGDTHWTLAFFLPKFSTCEIWDSWRTAHYEKDSAAMASTFAEKLLGQWRNTHAGKARKQKDDSSCGVFLVLHALFRASSVTVPEEIDIEYARHILSYARCLRQAKGVPPPPTRPRPVFAPGPDMSRMMTLESRRQALADEIRTQQEYAEQVTAFAQAALQSAKMLEQIELAVQHTLKEIEELPKLEAAMAAWIEASPNSIAGSPSAVMAPLGNINTAWKQQLRAIRAHVGKRTVLQQVFKYIREMRQSIVEEVRAAESA